MEEAARTATYAAGTKMVFEWNLNMGPHNVYQLPSAEALAACDFTDATVVDDSNMKGATSADFTIPAGTANGEQMFFACQIQGHCPSPGLTVTVTSDTTPVVKFDWLSGFMEEAARTATYAAGTKMVFEWNLNMGPHNVYQLPSAEALAACDFTDATVVDDSNTEGATSANFTIPAGTADEEQMFFACEIQGHCPLQVLTVTVASDADPAATAETSRTPAAANTADDVKVNGANTADDVKVNGATMFGTVAAVVAVAVGTIALA